MTPDLTLDQLTDAPQLIITIGDDAYMFSELPVAALGRLQAWIKQTVPHPIAALKPHLAGLDPEDRRVLLERAYDEALAWPPILGTPAGAQALLSNEAGQTEAFHEGLKVHQPETTRTQAARLYRALLRDADGSGGKKAARIFAILFGAPDPERAGPARPKDTADVRIAPTGD